MENYHRGQSRYLPRLQTSEYPIWSMLTVLGLIYLTPFVGVAAYLAFAVCVYRIIRFDVRIFSTDYCMLIPVSMIFRTGDGMSLLVYVCLIAAVWEVVRNGLRGNAATVTMLLLLNYLVARMQLSVTNFLLCFGQVLLLYVMLPVQDENSAERTVKAFCVSLLIASCYALLLRNTWQIRVIRGPEVPAYMGSTLRRFQGLFRDPNYYMTQLLTGIALMIQLGESRRVDPLSFWLFIAGFSLFGILTYSKTFFVLFALLVLSYIYLQFRNRRYGWGITLVILVLSMGGYLLFDHRSPFAVVMTRLLEANNISDLTTGRTDVLLAYLKVICHDPISLLFGQGMAAQGLYKDPHNLYLEILYYMGLTGLVLYFAFYWSLLRQQSRRPVAAAHKHWFSKYLVLLMALGLFCTLHGVFANMVYSVFYLAALPVLLPRKEQEHG